MENTTFDCDLKTEIFGINHKQMILSIKVLDRIRTLSKLFFIIILHHVVLKFYTTVDDMKQYENILNR